jgi:hypothetical protein
LKGYWEKLNYNLEYVKYTKPHLHYHNSVVRREWHNLVSEEVCVAWLEQSKQQKQREFHLKAGSHGRPSSQMYVVIGKVPKQESKVQSEHSTSVVEQPLMSIAQMCS